MTSQPPVPYRSRGLSLGLLVLGIVAWLWPIGLGGRMPVGGDVTQFSLGLMAVLRDALSQGRLPVWNDLWGFGFPGLGESQMGVYYPPHWLLYGLLPLEWAYTASLVFHTLLGGFGVYWAAQRFGGSPEGSALAGVAWSASGFFLIHLPHQWGYTVGAWAPWAWGLAWQVARGQGTRRSPWLLAIVLVLQILPGHFQLAFYTELGVVVLALAGFSREPSAWRRPVQAALALGAVFPLAALQLIPTARLALLASSRRDFEYLSGFAATPLHLVSYVAPGLFHRSPLWRPLAWDLFHTSPEEYLGYIGLVPLYLAFVAVVRGGRSDPATRALTLLTVVTVLFSFGPYVPGFRYLIMLPGFSFFRASARWSALSGLALALLAAKGFDLCRGWPRARLSLVGFAGVALAAPVLVVLGLELVLASPPPQPGSGFVAAWSRVLNSISVERVFTPTPASAPALAGDGQAVTPPSTASELRRLALIPQDDLRVQSALARQGRPWRNAVDRTFSRMRFSIYRQELTESTILALMLLAVAAPLARRPRCLAAALVTLTAVDLGLTARHRPTDLGPIRPLVEQSPVLARLAREPRGGRTVDSLRNMPMVAAAAPVSAYRTLDLPCVPELTQLAAAPPNAPGRPASVEALRAAGVAVRVFDPFETGSLQGVSAPLSGWSDGEAVHDPALAGWLYSSAWVAQQGERGAAFTLVRPEAPPAVAWLVPLTPGRGAEILEVRSSRVEHVLETLRPASPITAVERSSPTQLRLTVDVAGPALVVLSQLADPQWRAVWKGPGGEWGEAPIEPIFAAPRSLGWQAVRTPDSGGRWTLELDYDAQDVRLGLGASALAWGVAGLVYLLFSRIGNRTRGHLS